MLSVQIESEIYSEVYEFRAATDCSSKESITNTKKSIFALYGALWVVVMSFLPIFPAFHFPSKLLIVWYIFMSFFVDFPLVILLVVMAIVFRFAERPNDLVNFSYQQIQDASISQRVFISLFFCFAIFILIKFAFFLPYYYLKSIYEYEVSFFHSCVIHVANYIKVWSHGCIFCRVVWLNRFRDLFWWFSFLFFLFFMINPEGNHFFNLLSPSLLCQEC